MKISLLRHAAVIFLFLFISIQNTGIAVPSSESLSGDYQLHFEMTSKTCGAKINPVDTNVTLNFSDTNVAIKFPRGFLGINVLDAKYDSKTGTVSDHLEQRVSLGPTEATLSLDIKGNLVNRDSKPEIRYEISFNKTADDPDWNCKVKGKGRINKL